jgi:hypothetical protein
MAGSKGTSSRTATRFGPTPLLVLALAADLLPVFPARAGSVSASLSVSVVVPPRAILSVDSEPASLEISDEDVARGFVEVPRATRVQVRTNTPNGWLAELQVAQGPYRTIEVTGLGAPTQVTASGGWIPQPYPGTTRPVSLEVGYRFLLSADVRPGVYPWPVTLAAVPR